MEQLDSCSKSVRVKLLTQNIRDSGKLRRLTAAAASTLGALEVRTAPPKTLHDRYIVDDAAMVILGTSLNGFGKKQSFLIRAGADFRSVMVREFDRIWASATTWP